MPAPPDTWPAEYPYDPDSPIIRAWLPVADRLGPPIAPALPYGWTSIGQAFTNGVILHNAAGTQIVGLPNAD